MRSTNENYKALRIHLCFRPGWRTFAGPLQEKKSCDHSRSIYPGYQRFFSRCSAEDTCGEKEKTLTRTSFVVFTRAAKPREKTSGAEHFDLLFTDYPYFEMFTDKMANF